MREIKFRYYDKICKALVELAKRVDNIEQALLIQNDVNKDMARAMSVLNKKIDFIAESDKGTPIPVKRSDLH